MEDHILQSVITQVIKNITYTVNRFNRYNYRM